MGWVLSWVCYLLAISSVSAPSSVPACLIDRIHFRLKVLWLGYMRWPLLFHIPNAVSYNCGHPYCFLGESLTMGLWHVLEMPLHPHPSQLQISIHFHGHLAIFLTSDPPPPFAFPYSSLKFLPSSTSYD